MFRKRLLTAALSVGLANLAGCACCRHDAGHTALCPAEHAEDCTHHRGRVVAFVFGGADLLDVGDLMGLRDRVTAAGFANVYVGQFYHQAYFLEEMDRHYCEDPETRFLIVGSEAGTSAAVGAAAHARRAGYHLDAFFALDPVGPLDGTAHAFRSTQCLGSGVGAASVTNLSVGHFGLPTHPHVVAAVVGAMTASAGRAVVTEYTPPVLPLIDDPAPLPAYIPDEKPKGELIRTPATLTGRPR